MVYHSAKYRVLFGNTAEENLQATFKIVKNPDLVIDNNQIKSNFVSKINQYFALENWDFGEIFYFTELSAFIMQELAPSLVTIILVPKQTAQSFGSLYEIKSETDEIFISGATVENVEIIDAVTASRIRASGQVVTSVSTTNTGIQSTASTSTATSSTTTATATNATTTSTAGGSTGYTSTTSSTSSSSSSGSSSSSSGSSYSY